MNTSLIEAEPDAADLEVVALPCTALALESGHDRLVSVVALGALIGRRPLVARASIEAALREVTGQRHPELLAADLAAFDAGMEAAMAGTKDAVGSR